MKRVTGFGRQRDIWCSEGLDLPDDFLPLVEETFKEMADASSGAPVSKCLLDRLYADAIVLVMEQMGFYAVTAWGLCNKTGEPLDVTMVGDNARIRPDMLDDLVFRHWAVLSTPGHLVSWIVDPCAYLFGIVEPVESCYSPIWFPDGWLPFNMFPPMRTNPITKKRLAKLHMLAHPSADIVDFIMDVTLYVEKVCAAKEDAFIMARVFAKLFECNGFDIVVAHAVCGGVKRLVIMTDDVGSPEPCLFDPFVGRQAGSVGVASDYEIGQIWEGVDDEIAASGHDPMSYWVQVADPEQVEDGRLKAVPCMPHPMAGMLDTQLGSMEDMVVASMRFATLPLKAPRRFRKTNVNAEMAHRLGLFMPIFAGWLSSETEMEWCERIACRQIASEYNSRFGPVARTTVSSVDGSKSLVIEVGFPDMYHPLITAYGVGSTPPDELDPVLMPVARHPYHVVVDEIVPDLMSLPAAP
jgi:hypothetical protein